MGRKRGRTGALDAAYKPDRLDVAELIALVKRVNPTDRSLPSGERERRYREKSSLQSVLIRRFGADLSIGVEPGRPELVLLRHEALGTTCGHALISELDDDAASWVRLQLDLGDGDQEPSQEQEPWREAEREQEETTGDAQSMLRQGTAAIEDYDYERARELFEAALEATHGGVAAARALLELLVDTLGSDQEAIAVQDRLSRDAQAHAVVRTLLAQACARLGDVPGVLSRLKGVATPRATQLLSELALDAVRRKNVDDAESVLAQLRLRDPSHPALEQARHAWMAHRAAEHAPAEKEIRRLIDAGELDGAEAKARELLSHFPESEVARRAVAHVDSVRRSQRAQQALRIASALPLDSEHERVAALAREVIASGCDSEGEQERARDLLARAQARARDEQLARKVDKVAATLSEGATEGGLLAWCELPAEARAAVRARCPIELLHWLEPAIAERSASPRRVVQAARHVAAIAHLAESDPERFLEALGGHEQQLAGVEPVVRLVAGARQAREDLLASRSKDGLLRARVLLGQGQLEAARRSADAVEPQRLSAADRITFEELQREVRVQWERFQQLRKFEEEANPLTAIAMAVQHAEACEDEDTRRIWFDRATARRAKLESDWKVMRFGPEESGPWLSLLNLPDIPILARRYARRGTSPVVLGHAVGSFVVFVEIETTRSALLGGIAFKTPEPVGDDTEVVVEGDKVWLLSGTGCVLQLALPGWELTGWWSAGEIVPNGHEVEFLVLLPGGRTLSLFACDEKRGPILCLMDASSMEGRRWLEDSGPLVPLIGSTPPISLARRKDESASLIDARGLLVPGRRISTGQFPLSVAIGPDRQGLVMATADNYEHLAEQLRLLVLDASGMIVQRVLLEGTSVQSGVTLASSLDERMLYCLVGVSGRNPELIGLLWEVSKLTLAWRVPAPRGMVLVQDETACRTLAMVSGEMWPRFIALGRDAPTLPENRCEIVGELPHLGPCAAPCVIDDPEHNARTRRAYDRFESSGQQVHDFMTCQAGVVLGESVAVWQVLRYTAHNEAARQFLAELRDKHPNEPLLRELEAGELAGKANWSAARSILEQVDPTPLSPARRRHHYHLLGMALAAAGETEAAIAQLERGEAEPGSCPLQVWIDALRVPSPIGRNTPPTSPGSIVSRIVAALWSAWWCMGQGDLDGALAAVDREELWAAQESSCAGWLMRVLLARAEAGKHDGLIAAVGPAYMLGICRRAPEVRGHMPVPLQLRIDEKELQELAGKAESWIEQRVRSAPGQRLQGPPTTQLPPILEHCPKPLDL